MSKKNNQAILKDFLFYKSSCNEVILITMITNITSEYGRVCFFY